MAENVPKDTSELAFVLLRGEKLDREQSKLLDRVRSDYHENASLRDSVSLLRDVRECVPSLDRGVQPGWTDVDEELLAAFLDGSLDSAARERVLDLLAKSHEARCTLAELARCLEDAGLVDPRNVSAFEYLVGVTRDALRLLFHPNEGVTLLQAQVAPILGATESKTDYACEWTQSAGDLIVTFRIFRASGACVHLHVFVASQDLAASCYQVTFFENEKILQSTTVCNAEDCVFENIGTGIYRVEVTPLEREAVSFVLSLQPFS